MTQARTIVILGSGVGGVIAARELRRPRPHRIVLDVLVELSQLVLDNSVDVCTRTLALSLQCEDVRGSR